MTHLSDRGETRLLARRGFLGAAAAGLPLAGLGAAVGAGVDAGRGRGWRRTCPVVIDFHAHFLDAKVLQLAQPHSPSSGFGAMPLPADAPFMRKMFDPALQIADMDARRIDRAVISSAAVIEGLSFAEGAVSRDLNARLNDIAVDWVARYPRRFIGSFVLPLDDIDAALREVERASAAGLRIANMPANWRGRYLGEPYFEPLWTAFERLGTTVFIHPDGTRDPWFQKYMMWNSIGQSIEEVKVMTSLIYEGTLERHPGLKLVMAHGGGYMPHYMGRLDRNAVEKPATMANISRKPSAYLDRFHYDSCVFDPVTLDHLIARVGVERIVMAGDYPVAAVDPLQFLEANPSLSDDDIAAIAGNNAVRLLGLGITATQ